MAICIKLETSYEKNILLDHIFRKKIKIIKPIAKFGWLMRLEVTLILIGRYLSKHERLKIGTNASKFYLYNIFQAPNTNKI